MTCRVLICVLVSAASLSLRASEPDVPFVQEVHAAWPLPDANVQVTSIAVGKGSIALGTESGLYLLDPKTGRFQLVNQDVAVFDLDTTAEGDLLVSDVQGLSVFRDGRQVHLGIQRPVAIAAQRTVDAQVQTVALGPDGIWQTSALGSDGKWRPGDRFQKSALPSSAALREAVIDDDGSVWIATGMGLTRYSSDETRQYLHAGEIYSSAVRDVVIDNRGRVWAGSYGGISIYENGELVQELTPASGLPTVYVQCLASGPDGRMWVGTRHGVARFDGEQWSCRYGRRWLLDDDVRDIAFDADGTAWVATRTGISAIRRQEMTLEEKAKLYHEISEARHVRPPGIEEKAVLQTPGDLSSWRPEDTDNDGGYTAMYVVMQSHRYAVTGEPEAKAQAQRGIEALSFLEEVTGVPGFFARSVIPPEWDHMRDANRTYTDKQKLISSVKEPRYKPVEVRWHLTEDGKWRWKGDTSSDEVTSHFFAFHYYYDLVADDEEKQRVAALAKRIMDHIIDGGYVFRDVDGEHTRWGVWAPERLNHDPEWQAERGINSVEILSFLKATWHMTGDERYQQEYLRLLNEHGYADNVRKAKTYAVAWRTFIDDELLCQAWPALFKYETDPELRALYRESLDHLFEGARDSRSPYYNYTYAMLSGNERQHDESVAFLRDCPLDLINWFVDHRWREDIQRARYPVMEQESTSRLLPVSERSVVRWDKNQWMMTAGDGGRTEWSPTFWLLPYWMGRYYGYIAAP